MDVTTPVPHECAQGRLLGSRQHDILRFAGIPYGQPPVGPRRWQRPLPAKPWSGTRDATRFGAACPQAPTQLERVLGHALGDQSEDCLFLNVWTPSLTGRRPVMVWIHGGAFMIGAGSQSIYDGTLLAAQNVVVVTFNYRLGAFGFVALREVSGGALPATGCEGLADQLLALDWVRRNISAFGGDPDNITVFGESAGAMSIGALLAAPAARGLFHKAIAQSGAAHIGHDRERAARAGRAFLAALGLEPQAAARALELPYGAIVSAQIAMQAAAREGHNPHRLGALPFQPVLDGELLPGAPILGIRAGTAAGIPLLAGTNLEEWKLFTAANPALRLMSKRAFHARLERFAGEGADALAASYAGTSVFEQFNAFMTDKVFVEPCQRLLEAQTVHGASFAYRCDWKSKLFGGLMGACHAVELGFLFGAYRERLAGAFFGQGPQADALSADMIRAWTRFARTGEPGWPAYEPRQRQVQIFGDGPPHRMHAPQSERRHAFASIPDRRLGP